MVIDEYKIDSTTIKFYDRDLGTEDNNKEIINTIITLILKKVSEYF